MLIVADSGSTKTSWLLADNGNVIKSFSTMGFNPFFHDSKTVFKELNKNKALKKYAGSISEVRFFGAGCSSSGRNKIIASGLQKFFTRAKIEVEHDLLASALATCNGKPGITCILGTGSNACYYDGKKLAEVRHGIGYVLGDEGSGSYFGKKLLAFYCYKILPKDLYNDFYKKYRLSKEDITRKVYNEPDPNVFLASFALFLSAHLRHPYIKKMIGQGMNYFLKTNVLSYREHKQVPVHFVGSVAYSFRNFLKAEAKKLNIKTGIIIKEPIEHLMKYFLKKKIGILCCACFIVPRSG